jgi:hypothetical protein
MARIVRRLRYKFDTRFIRVKLYEYRCMYGVDMQFIADKLQGITTAALRKKLHGDIPFTIDDIATLRIMLGLTDEEVGRMFFTIVEDSGADDVRE